MTHRERVLATLNHEEPDRLPMDLGASVVTSISLSAYKSLVSHLGLPERDPVIFDIVEQIVFMDEDVRTALDVDVLPVVANPPSKPLRLQEEPCGGSSFIDDFGAKLVKHEGCLYYDWREFPLSEPSINALESISWPDPSDAALYDGLRDRTLRLRKETDYALFGMAPNGHDLMNLLFRVRGMEEGLMDLMLNQEFAEAFLEKLTETIMESQRRFLDEVGDLIDIHFAADDFAAQSGLLISPSVFRNLIKPRWKRIIDLIKSKTNAKIFFHSCGCVLELIPDLIEIGVDILNPVQVSAAGMGTDYLKKEFGNDLSFWGGGCDTQKTLPFGTPADVKAEVRQRIQDLAPEGGFVFNPVHNIQHGVPPENIIALFDAAREFGIYQS